MLGRGGAGVVIVVWYDVLNPAKLLLTGQYSIEFFRNDPILCMMVLPMKNGSAINRVTFLG